MRKVKFGSRKARNRKNMTVETEGFSVNGVEIAENRRGEKSPTEAGTRKTPFSSLKKQNKEQGADKKEGFTVNVRNTEPMLTVCEHQTKGRRLGLFKGISSPLVLAAALSLLLLTADAVTAIPCVLACIVMFIIVTLVKTKVNERFRLITMIVIVVILAAALIILRKYIGNGLALIVNGIFEMSEDSQAYIYDMYSVGSKGDSSPGLCIGIAAAWCSAAAGFLIALPGERWRGLINTVILLAVMVCYAYFGVIPYWAGTMALIAAFLLSAGSGRLNSAWPIILAVLLVFGGITLLDPGENYTVSRANENLRDLFAFKTALIQGSDSSSMEDEYMDEEEDWSTEDDSEYYEEDYEEGSIWKLIAIIMIPVALIAAALIWLHIRLSRKRKAIRADINSKDPNTAIGAMFPYAVRWLQCIGINVSNTAFSELAPAVKADMDGDYAARYDSMLNMWREAVFSNHELTEENRATMAAFMRDTISIAKKRSGLKEKLKVRFKYAL